MIESLGHRAATITSRLPPTAGAAALLRSSADVRMRRNRFIPLAVLSVAAAASLATADASVQTPTSFGERVEVNLVNVEAFVTDAHGRAVSDLRADDFTLYVDGQPVPIRHFDRVERPSAAAATDDNATAASPPAPLHLVVFLDELHSSALRRPQVFADLAAALDRDLPAGARVMVVRYEGTPEVLQPFTDQPRKMRDALALAQERVSARSLAGDQDRRFILEAIHDDATTGGPCLHTEALARGYSERQRGEVLATIGELDRFVGTLEGLPGRKAVLYLSDGLPLRPGEEAWDYYLELCGGTGAARGVQVTDPALFGEARFHRPDPQKLRLESATFDTSDEWTALAARANGQGVSLFALTAGRQSFEFQLDSETRMSGVSRGDAALNQRDALFLLASETGAFAIEGSEDLANRLHEALATLDRYYLLSFEPPAPGDGRMHQLRVEVARPGVAVRHRRSYAIKSEERRVSDRLLAQVLYGIGANDLGLRLAAAPAPGAGVAPPPGREGALRIRLLVPLRGLTLFPAEGARRGLLTAFLVARDGAGKTTPVRQTTVPIAVPEGDLEAALGRDFVYEVAFDLPPGRYMVGAAVRDEASGTTAYVRQDLQHHPRGWR
jgi:VWFA-related protein